MTSVGGDPTKVPKPDKEGYTGWDKYVKEQEQMWNKDWNLKYAKNTYSEWIRGIKYNNPLVDTILDRLEKLEKLEIDRRINSIFADLWYDKEHGGELIAKRLEAVEEKTKEMKKDSKSDADWILKEVKEINTKIDSLNERVSQNSAYIEGHTGYHYNDLPKELKDLDKRIDNWAERVKDLEHESGKAEVRLNLQAAGLETERNKVKELEGKLNKALDIGDVATEEVNRQIKELTDKIENHRDSFTTVWDDHEGRITTIEEWRKQLDKFYELSSENAGKAVDRLKALEKATETTDTALRTWIREGWGIELQKLKKQIEDLDKQFSVISIAHSNLQNHCGEYSVDNRIKALEEWKRQHTANFQDLEQVVKVVNRIEKLEENIDNHRNSITYQSLHEDDIRLENRVKELEDKLNRLGYPDYWKVIDKKVWEEIKETTTYAKEHLTSYGYLIPLIKAIKKADPTWCSGDKD